MQEGRPISVLSEGGVQAVVDENWNVLVLVAEREGRIVLELAPDVDFGTRTLDAHVAQKAKVGLIHEAITQIEIAGWLRHGGPVRGYAEDEVYGPA
jgi:hypothetical protein